MNKSICEESGNEKLDLFFLVFGGGKGLIHIYNILDDKLFEKSLL